MGANYGFLASFVLKDGNRCWFRIFNSKTEVFSDHVVLEYCFWGMATAISFGMTLVNFFNFKKRVGPRVGISAMLCDVTFIFRREKCCACRRFHVETRVSETKVYVNDGVIKTRVGNHVILDHMVVSDLNFWDIFS